MKTTSTILLSVVALAASSMLATAQDAAGGQGGQAGGGRRGGQGGNPEEFRQRMNDRLKTSLKATDEEWAAIQPLIEKVQAKQREGGRFGGGGGRGGRGGNNDDAQQATRPGQAESEALRTALESDSSTPEDLKAKLEAVRAHRKKSAAELASAREDLKKVLTVRQEAALVAAGILE
ncbi:MAG TPA: hypothetical protein VF593_05190 [Chthoniobacteraceae bacterium]|jgi:Spy/CpxP family protein refolding chaperone